MTLFLKCYIYRFNFVEAKPCAWWHPYDDKQTDDGYYVGFKESVSFLKEFMTKEVMFRLFTRSN